MEREIRIAFVGDRASVNSGVGRVLNSFSGLESHLATLAAPRKVSFTEWPEALIGMTDLPMLATYRLVIMGWSKIGVLLARFLRENPEFPAKLVLYSGVYLGSDGPFADLTLEVPVEESQDFRHGERLDVSLTPQRIAQMGIFDYFISKERREWSANSWTEVIQELDSKPPNRAPLEWAQCLPYFIYRWPKYEFRDYGWHVYIVSKGYERWYLSPIARHRCIERFSTHFEGDLMDQTGEVFARPIWGKPTLDRDALGHKCFVLMPFREPFNTIYKDHIAPPLAELGIQCYRADDLYSTGAVIQDIWNGINNCAFLIAELTSKNPNVMYELGIAHSLGRKVILISQDDGDVPFDFRHLRYRKYDFTPRGSAELERYLAAATAELIAKHHD